MGATIWNCFHVLCGWLPPLCPSCILQPIYLEIVPLKIHFYSGMDRIFPLTSDFTGFVSPEVFKKAWLAVILAGFTWSVFHSAELAPFLGQIHLLHS